MAEIEKAVQDQFASLAANPGSRPAAAAALPARHRGAHAPRDVTTAEPETPFASIDEITPQSPADIAGLKVGDKIVKFGIVHWMNHERLRKVAEVVSQNEGVRHNIL
jgi:26S proteasome non-ATPase regulatory subunit 9